MRKLFSVILFALVIIVDAKAQEYFTIKQYEVVIKVNKDASLDISETINVHFTEPRHGIIRRIPYKYEIQALPAASQKADRQLESGGYTQTIVDNINVPGWKYDVSNEGNYKSDKNWLRQIKLWMAISDM